MAITQNKATSQLVERLQNAKIAEERREAGVFLQDKEVVLGDPDCRGVFLGQLFTFEMLDTTVFHGKLWSGTMLESHEDVGDEVAKLIENLATIYYGSAY